AERHATEGRVGESVAEEAQPALHDECTEVGGEESHHQSRCERPLHVGHGEEVAHSCACSAVMGWRWPTWPKARRRCSAVSTSSGGPNERTLRLSSITCVAWWRATSQSWVIITTVALW